MNKRNFIRRMRGYGLSIPERAKMFKHLSRTNSSVGALYDFFREQGFDYAEVVYPDCPCCVGLRDKIFFRRSPKSLVRVMSAEDIPWV